LVLREHACWKIFALLLDELKMSVLPTSIWHSHGHGHYENEQINASYTDGQQSQDRTK
jgi:hypothetical protein